MKYGLILCLMQKAQGIDLARFVNHQVIKNSVVYDVCLGYGKENGE